MKKLNWKGVAKETWVRIIALFLIWVNLISVSIFDFELIPFSDAQIYEGVSVLLTVLVTFWTTWKNNDFTPEAQEFIAKMRETKKKNK